MSAMLEPFDMQMADYSGDLDIQMHPSSSDQWFQDPESKMEEDGPTLFEHGDGSHFKSDTYTQARADTTIEVDMEPFLDHSHPEYDMIDDEEYREPGTEIHDVELYDVSFAHSPAMAAIDVAQGETTTFATTFKPTNLDSLNKDFTQESLNLELTPAQTRSLSAGEENAPYRDNVETVFHHDTDVVTDTQIHKETESKVGHSEPTIVHEHALPILTEASEDPQPEKYQAGGQEIVQAVETLELLEQSHAAPREDSSRDELDQRSLPEESHVTDGDDAQALVHAVVANSHTTDVDGSETQADLADENLHHDPSQTETSEAEENNVQPPDSGASVGDPHEISEGVYIDPPPPVLLSVGSDEQFNFSFFNQAERATSPGEGEPDQGNDHVLLAQLPTLYYEPISTVFEALRQEEVTQRTFNLLEAELVLESVDLQLVISEDNVYTREVTLHDLNVLHDASGIKGSLRIKLYAFSPRFISRYQHLQEEVSRLHIDPPVGDYPTEGGVEAEVSHEDTAQQQAEQASASKSKGGQIQAIRTDNTSLHSEGDQRTRAPSQQSNLVSEDTALQLPPTDPHGEEHNSADEVQSGQTNENATISASKDNTSENPTHHSTPSHHSYIIDEHYEHSNLGAEDDVLALETVEVETVEASPEDDAAHVEGEYPPHSVNQLHQDDQSNEQQDEYEYADYQDHVDFEAPTSAQQDGGEQAAESDQKYEISKTTADEVENVDHETLPELEEEEEAEEEVAYEPDYAVDPDLNYEEVQSTVDSGLDSEHTVDIEAAQVLTTAEESTERDFSAPQTIEAQPDTYDFGEENWEDDPDGEGDPDTTWDDNDDENEHAHSISNASSITLSSKASKRSFDEFEDDGDGQLDEDGLYRTPPSSPGAKRSRTQ